MTKTSPSAPVALFFIVSALGGGSWLAASSASHTVHAASTDDKSLPPPWTLGSSFGCFSASCAWYAPVKRPLIQQGVLGEEVLPPPGTLYLSNNTATLTRKACGQKVTLSSEGLLQVQIAESGLLRLLGVGRIEYEGKEQVGPCALRLESGKQPRLIVVPPIQAGSQASHFSLVRDPREGLEARVTQGELSLDWMDQVGALSIKMSKGQHLTVEPDAVATRFLELSSEAVAQFTFRLLPAGDEYTLPKKGFPSDDIQHKMLKNFSREVQNVQRVDSGTAALDPLHAAWFTVLRNVTPEASASAALELFAALPNAELTPEALYEAHARLTFAPLGAPDSDTTRAKLQADLETALGHYAGSVWAGAVMTTPAH